MASAAKENANMQHIKRSGKFAEEEVGKIFEGSSFFNDNIGKYYPRFELSELVRGKRLGCGGFGVVYEVSGVDLGEIDLGDMDEVYLELQHENRTFISDHCIRQKQEKEGGGDARYAIKLLLPETITNPHKYFVGIKDMVIETHFLSRIEHPHIIKMRAFSNAGMFQPNYFLVLDRLYDTLETRIIHWRKQSRRLSRHLSMERAKKDKKKALAEERLVTAYGLVAAIQYLHDKKIVHRDLKPDNIGFDVRGDVKIFDFGLAKELKREDKVDANENLYNLTGLTGTIRYMAPEVYKMQPYNQSVDIYSFAMCLWEMFSFCAPFQDCNTQDMFEKVVILNECRPQVEEKWPLPLKLLLNRGWSSNMKERPSAQTAIAILKKELIALRAGNEAGLDHYGRKSTYIMRETIGRRDSSRASWVKRLSQRRFLPDDQISQTTVGTSKTEHDRTCT